MNREDLFEAIGTADETMLERSEKKVNRKRNWLISATAAAACFALLFGIVWQYIRPNNYGPSHNIVEDNFFWVGQPDYHVPYFSSGNGGNSSGSTLVQSEPSYQFGREKSVHVEIQNVLPDVYCEPGSTTAYHILHLKVLDTIVGEDMPSEIYFLLPGYLSADLKKYDSFIMTLEQAGFEDYLMFNITKKRAETFTLLFRSPERSSSVPVPIYMGAVMAFKNNKLDMSLWDKEGWNLGKTELEKWTAVDGNKAYPGKVGRNIQDTKEAILQLYEQLKGWYFLAKTEVITTDHFDWAEAKEALAYIKSLGIGAFDQYYKTRNNENIWAESHVDEITYTRVINGFLTNETIYIYCYEGSEGDKEYKEQYVQYSEARFTEKDLKHLPDLAGFINNASAMELPSVDKESQLYSTYGCYQKHGDDLFGIVYLYWGDLTDDGPYEWQTTTFHLLCPDGTVREAATRQEIDKLIAQYQG